MHHDKNQDGNSTLSSPSVALQMRSSFGHSFPRQEVFLSKVRARSRSFLSFRSDHGTELDAYFEEVPLFVPGSHIEPDATAREKALRRGEIVVGDQRENILEVYEGKEKV